MEINILQNILFYSEHPKILKSMKDRQIFYFLNLLYEQKG